ncbi:MAG: hypothetical protein FVQ83_16270 [Chloroflexi bacterium]|nr:hypothetical protein [Chloroflexota bacterium]
MPFYSNCLVAKLCYTKLERTLNNIKPREEKLLSEIESSKKTISQIESLHSDSPSGYSSTEKKKPDSREYTSKPLMAALMSIIAGGVELVVADFQINTPDDLTVVAGVINAFVSLAYFWLAVQLIQRREQAYKRGLQLAIGNFFFVSSQGMFWNFIAEGNGTDVPVEFLAILFSFLGTDFLLAVSIAWSYRDFVYPLESQRIPEFRYLINKLAINNDITEEEREFIRKARRGFIAYMSATHRGGIEINSILKEMPVDLVAKPLISFMGGDAGKGDTRYYLFRTNISVELVKKARGTRSYVFIIGISTSDDIKLESKRGLLKRLSLYTFRDGVRTGRRSKEFEKFAESNFGKRFRQYRKMRS